MTGASRGLGAGDGAALAAAGADVVLHASAQPADATARAIARHGRPAHRARDGRSRAGRRRGDARAPGDRRVRPHRHSGQQRRHDPARVRPPIIRTTDWDAVIAVNLSSVFRLCRAVGRHMIDARRGRQDHQHRVAARVSGRHHRARLRGRQGRRRAADQGARQRVGVASHQRQRDRARLHGDGQHHRAPAGRDALPADHRTDSGRPVGPARRISAARSSSWRHRPPTTCTDTCWSSTADGWADERAASISFRKFVGPAALTAAGMIGAGAVATRLLAGAWFGFDLLWVALYVIPMVIFTLDSASRVAILNGGRGMFEMIRTRHRRLARVVDLPADRARERHREHEPDVRDGRRHLRRRSACCRRSATTTPAGPRRGHARRRRSSPSSPRCSAATSASRRS